MRPRPLYEADCLLPPDMVRERVRAALARGGLPVEGSVSKKHVTLRVAEAEAHTWSPHISIELTETDDGTYLRGYFGPHPYLWGLYLAVYAAQVLIFMFAGMWGWVSWSLELPATGLWIAGAMVGTLALSCATNIAGEWAGAPQMALVRGFLASTLELEDRGAIRVGAAGPVVPQQ